MSGSRLDPGRLALHQAVRFHEESARVRALGEREAFRLVPRDRCLRAEWTRLDPEDDDTPFAFARVCSGGGALVIESFSEEWLRAAEREISGGTAWPHDETRALPFERLLENPNAICGPAGQADSPHLARREVAELYLRLAWPFLPNDALGGRTPSAVAETASGRERLEILTEALPDSLREAWACFPDLDADEMRDILFPRRVRRATGEPAPIPDPRRT
ncbi:MAG: hypothetical protein R3B81_00695 [bacterium]